MERPFRFGIPLAQEGSAKELAEEARAAEGLGYSTVQAFDQLRLAPSSPMPILGFAAAATKTIRLSAYVFDNGYRHPVLLAKEAAVLDRISGGRLELGIGAGYSELEYRGSGIPFPEGAERVARLAEAVAILKAVFADGPVSFTGHHYRLDEYQPAAVPTQRPRPPLMIAGARRRLLAFAAREADIVSLAVHDWRTNASLEATREKLAWVRDAAGDRLGDMELEILVQVRFGTDRKSAALESSARSGIPVEQLLSTPHVVFGTPEEMAETLRERRSDLGLSYLSVRPRQRMHEFAEVIRRLT